MTLREVGVVGAGVLACSLPAAAGQRKPNVLIVVSDDQSYPYAGAYGCDWIRTPGFDYVAEHGILFNNCYTPNAKSAPSRACLLTGRYSWQLEEAANHVGNWPEGKYPTLFETLAVRGWHAGYTTKGWAPGNAGDRLLTGVAYNARLVSDPPAQELSKYDYAANFEDFLADANGRPWIFWMGVREPHRRYQKDVGQTVGGKRLEEVDRVPGYWPDDATVRGDMLDFAFEVEYYDTHLQRSLELLRQAGMLDNTIVIVTSDNGMPFPRRKGSTYECSTHVPLAVMWPDGLARPGRTEDALVSFVDLSPTILSLVGEAPGAMQIEGRSFARIITEARHTHRDYLLFGRERHDDGRPENQGYPVRGILKDGFLYLRNYEPERWPHGNPEAGYRDTDSSPTKTEILDQHRSGADFPYWDLCFGLRPAEELYDLRSDPDCLVNLADDPAFSRRMKRLRRLLLRDLRRQKDPRIIADGSIFDHYPYYRPDRFDHFYERYLSGTTTPKDRGSFLPSDYEPQ